MSETHAAMMPNSPIGVVSVLGGWYDNLRRRQPVLAAFAFLMLAAMGVAIVVVMAITVWIGVQCLRSHEGGISPTLRLSIGLGLILGTLLGTASGVAMSQHYSHWVGGAASDAGGVPLFGWSRAGGDLRVAHFVGLHAMQGLPFIGWLAERSSSGRGWVFAAALVWVGLSAAVFIQAWQGKPFLPF